MTTKDVICLYIYKYEVVTLLFIMAEFSNSFLQKESLRRSSLVKETA
jgi:hypothetical protein